MFIVFEGLDGAGKSAAVRMLASHINLQQNAPALVTSDLNHSTFGNTIKSIMYETVTAEARYDCILLARAHHVFNTLIPAIMKNQFIVCDRYLHSNLAYQGGGMGLSQNAILSDHHCKGFPYPDFVFYLDISPGTAASRLSRKSSENQPFAHNRDFLQKARESYLEYFSDDIEKNCKFIDAEQPTQSVHREILLACKELQRTD